MRAFGRLALALLVVVGVVVVVVAAAPAAGADVIVLEVGWWTRNPAASAPTGGIDVAAAPDGPSSVAAIAVTGSDSVTKALLLFGEAGGLQQDGAGLQVCITPNPWQSGPAQAWADAPKADCALTSVKLERNASTGSWSADVTSLLGDLEDEGRVDLMVVPANTGAVPLGFDVQLRHPELQVEIDESSSSSDDTSGSSSSGGSSDGSGGTGSSAGSGEGTSSEFSSASERFDSEAPVVPPAPATADGTAGTSSDGASSIASDVASSGDNAELAALPTQASTGAETGGGSRTVQALFFVLIATIAGAVAGAVRWFVRQRSPDGGAFA